MAEIDVSAYMRHCKSLSHATRPYWAALLLCVECTDRQGRTFTVWPL